MTWLVLAVAAFAGLHLIPALPNLKTRLRANLGSAFGPLYGAASLAALIIALWAFRFADRPELYDPPFWGRHANFALTLVAFVFIGIFLFRGSWRNQVRFPMALAVIFWGTGHLLANGDAASFILFAGLMLAALAHAVMVHVNKTQVPSDERAGHNLISVLSGIALYGVFAQLHGVLVGVPVFSLTG